jgi:hypothetical protein
MIDEGIPIIIRVVELVVSSSAVGLTIAGLSMRGRERLLKALTKHHVEAMTAVNKTKEDMDARFDQSRREVGETVFSVRQQITDLGFFVRDNYTRDRDFQIAVTSIKDMINVGIEKLEARCMRIEAEVKNGHHTSGE